MLLTLVVILVLIGSAVVGSLYSNILVFYENFTETDNYHKARYAAIAATERAELVIKQRDPGYVGSGGWILGQVGNVGISPTDEIISDFSYLSNSGAIENKSTVLRNINSRTDRVPASGQGNVDKLLSVNDSKNYNMMDYNNSEIFLLYYDNSNGNPYEPTTNIRQTKLDKIKVAIRLPGLIKDTFGILDTAQSLTPEGKANDPIVDRQLRGNYSNKPFTIYATQRYETHADSAIREDDINNSDDTYRKIIYEDDRWNPIRGRFPSSDDNDPANTLTIISPEDTAIKALNGFGALFQDESSNKNLQFKLSLLNLLQGTNGSGMIYPFLEYYIEFTPHGSNPVILSDKYYTIETEGNFGDYKINNIIFKPTITESILKSFTTIL